MPSTNTTPRRGQNVTVGRRSARAKQPIYKEESGEDYSDSDVVQTPTKRKQGERPRSSSATVEKTHNTGVKESPKKPNKATKKEEKSSRSLKRPKPDEGEDDRKA